MANHPIFSASLAAIVRIIYAEQLLENSDYLYNFIDFAIWTTVEIGLALSASSLATLRPLMRKLKILSSTEIRAVTLDNMHNRSGSYQQVGRVAHLDTKAPNTPAGTHGIAVGSSKFDIYTRDMPGSRSFDRGGDAGWRGMDETSSSDIDLIIQRG